MLSGVVDVCVCLWCVASGSYDSILINSRCRAHYGRRIFDILASPNRGNSGYVCACAVCGG